MYLVAKTSRGKILKTQMHFADTEEEALGVVRSIW